MNGGFPCRFGAYADKPFWTISTLRHIKRPAYSASPPIICGRKLRWPAIVCQPDGRAVVRPGVRR